MYHEDNPLHASDDDKIRDYRTDYNNRPSNNTLSFIPVVPVSSGHIHCELVRILCWQTHGKPTASFQLQELRMCNITITCSVSDYSLFFLFLFFFSFFFFFLVVWGWSLLHVCTFSLPQEPLALPLVINKKIRSIPLKLSKTHLPP